MLARCSQRSVRPCWWPVWPLYMSRAQLPRPQAAPLRVRSSQTQSICSSPPTSEPACSATGLSALLLGRARSWSCARTFTERATGGGTLWRRRLAWSSSLQTGLLSAPSPALAVSAKQQAQAHSAARSRCRSAFRTLPRKPGRCLSAWPSETSLSASMAVQSAAHRRPPARTSAILLRPLRSPLSSRRGVVPCR